MNKQELFEKIDAFYTEFKEEHSKSSKISQQRARKAIGEVKKLITDYRQASVNEVKE